MRTFVDIPSTATGRLSGDMLTLLWSQNRLIALTKTFMMVNMNESQKTCLLFIFVNHREIMKLFQSAITTDKHTEILQVRFTSKHTRLNARNCSVFSITHQASVCFFLTTVTFFTGS